MTTTQQSNPPTARKSVSEPKHVLDDQDMRRFMPPGAPLSMPQQDLTPRFDLRRMLSAIRLSAARR